MAFNEFVWIFKHVPGTYGESGFDKTLEMDINDFKDKILINLPSNYKWDRSGRSIPGYFLIHPCSSGTILSLNLCNLINLFPIKWENYYMSDFAKDVFNGSEALRMTNNNRSRFYFDPTCEISLTLETDDFILELERFKIRW